MRAPGRPAPTLDALVAAGRARPGLTPEGKARILAAVHLASAPAGLQPPPSPAGTPSGAPAARAASALGGATLGGRLALATVSFLLGAGSVATYVALRPERAPSRAPAPAPRTTRPSPPTGPVTRPPLPPVSEDGDETVPAAHPGAQAPGPGADAGPGSGIGATAGRSRPPNVRRSLPSGDPELAAERALLEQASAALSRGRPEDALAALAAHRARFGRGRLGEERDALRVQALAASGRRDDAAEGARRFRAEHPRSLLLPAVEAHAPPTRPIDAVHPWWEPATSGGSQPGAPDP